MSVAEYFNLNTPAPKRLAMLRADFASFSVRYPHCPEYAKPKTWRDLRGTTHKGLRAYGIHGLHAGKQDGTPIWYSHGGPNFRDEKAVQEWEDVRINHTGWYTDELCDEKAVGIVGLLSHGRFIAGYYWSSDDERVYFPEVHDSIRDAAYAADEHARVFAEEQREFDIGNNEYARVETDIEDKLQRLRECMALRRKACTYYVRDDIETLIKAVRKNRERLATELKEYAP